MGDVTAFSDRPGDQFFRANKQGRNTAFSVPASDGGSTVEGNFSMSPSGGDKNTGTHVQPADVSQANRVLPGEQDDPRFC